MFFQKKFLVNSDSMQALRETIYSFKARWFDTHAQLHRQYNVRYFVDTHNVEIFDTKTSRLFLKKSECPAALSAKDFYLGANVLIHGRHFELHDYLDPFTAEKLGRQHQKSVLVIKARMVDHIGAIIDFLAHHQFKFAAIKMMQVKRPHAEKLYELQRGTAEFEERVHQLTDAPIVAMELEQENCLDHLKKIVADLSTRFDALPGEFESAASVLETQRLREFFFEVLHTPTATFHNCTCCVVLPHILKEGLVGEVVAAIQRGEDVRITAMELFTLDRTTAAEFLEIYKGVVPHFHESVDHFTSGPCLAMELVGCNTNDVVARFRASAGPWDAQMAKELQPQTLRAMFGHDRVRNAVHCTDLAEDGVLESRYFFDILSRRQVHSYPCSAQTAYLEVLVSILGGIVFGRDDKTSTFARAAIDRLNDIDHLGFVVKSPIDFVIVAGSEINHDVFVPKKKHDRARVIELVHGIKVRHFGNVHDVDHGKILDVLCHAAKYFIHLHTRRIMVVSKTNDHDTVTFV
ncbi:hypothetical protein PsorP6_015027 [Peronosclerospora sorghi]|uniref:Uncharacterized protein n=1 Tax=Peronosclerospora sorghi TaxID=230839 RepID=A0ACC0VTC6_9STRA|nr:hypothetical protein PsorP6_015027 [Peronosclerospora sorghi]